MRAFPQITSEYLYDIDHRLVDQIVVSGPASLGYSRANIYAGGEYLGEDAPDSLVKTPSATASMLRITDQAGSLRSRWDLAGNTVTECTSFPYGEGYSCTGATPPTLYSGKDRDPETGFDYFGARYYSSSMGRFTSPDWSSEPIPLAYADFANPQSLNLYSYTYNSPLNRIDRDGHCPPCIVAAVIVVAAAGYEVYKAVKAFDKFMKSADAASKSNATLLGDVINDKTGNAAQKNVDANLQAYRDGVDFGVAAVSAAGAVSTVADSAMSGTTEAVTNPGNATETVSDAATEGVQRDSEISDSGPQNDNNLPDAPAPQMLPPPPPQTRPDPPQT